MEKSIDPVKTGVYQSKQMLELARSLFAGACIMPPFDHYEVLEDILNFDFDTT